MTLSIQELKDKAKEDTTYDKNKIDLYSVELPKLTSNWNTLMFEENLLYQSLTIQFDRMKRQKYEYYRYKHEHIIEPKGKEMDIYLNSDADLLVLREKVVISKEKQLFIESTIKVLGSASFNIGNYIKWNQFMSGSY